MFPPRLLTVSLLVWFGAVVLVLPRSWLPQTVQDFLYAALGASSYQRPPDTADMELGTAEPFCPNLHPDWRQHQIVAGVPIEESLVCEPDNPAEVAAFVRGTNNVPMAVLMQTRLTPTTVVKDGDRDGDGDPDVIHIRLEVAELNGRSPDIPGPFPRYAIAPGVEPGLWVFAPKTRGMATENFDTDVAHPNLRAPAPVIRVEQGDRLRLTLENTHYLPHTIHLHGVDHPFVDSAGEGNDGVPVASEPPVLPGQSRTYDLRPRQTGTMFYHCHVQPNVHIVMGLQGMFVVEENQPNNWVQTLNPGAGQVRFPSQAVRQTYDREYDLHYQDLDQILHEMIQTANDPRLLAEATNRGYDSTDQTPDYFVLNGRSFPYTMRESLVVVKPDQNVKLRVLNGGVEGIALHTHGHKVRITHYDGVEHNPAAQITRDVVWLAPAQRLDLHLRTVNDGLHNYGPGVWLLHDHRGKGVTTNGINPGGNISAIVYESFLAETGWPKTQGMDWTPFFSPAYYQRKVPIWGTLDDSGLLGQATSRTLNWGRAVLIGLLSGLLLGGLAAGLRAVVRRLQGV